MNPLLLVLAAANPLVTGLLTFIVFTEKQKVQKRAEKLEAALKACNAEVVSTIAAQKEGFESICAQLQGLSAASENSSQSLLAGVKAGNAEVVSTISAQKQGFESIASRLEGLSKDSAKSAETFVGLSTALTESSVVSAKALDGVTNGLATHSQSLQRLIDDLAHQVTTTTKTAIGDLGKTSEQTLESVSKEVQKVEHAQTSVAGAVKDLQETLKLTVSL